MPRYSYKCEKCDDAFEAYHGMGEKLVRCEKCDTDSLIRIPSSLLPVKKEGLQRPGVIVDSYIENAKKEIEREKERLKSRDIK